MIYLGDSVHDLIVILVVGLLLLFGFMGVLFRRIIQDLWPMKRKGEK